MRNIFIVSANQVVVSDSHPEGLFSTMSGYPKTFDSRSYSDDSDSALKALKGINNLISSANGNIQISYFTH